MLFTGSTKKTASPRSGSLPSSTNRIVPMTIVIASAISGDATDIARDGSGRTSSFSTARLAGPQTAHPLADPLDRRFARRHARRDAAARDDEQPVADLEQLVELLADDEHRAAGVAQREQFAPDLCRGADVDTPGRLRNDEELGLCVDLAADDELLQVAAREALRRRARAAGLDVEALDERSGERLDVADAQPPARADRARARQERVLRERERRHRAATEPLLGNEVQALAAASPRRRARDVALEELDRSGRR